MMLSSFYYNIILNVKQKNNKECQLLIVFLHRCKMYNWKWGINKFVAHVYSRLNKFHNDNF